MRTANIALGVLMLAFAAVQYNDPDPYIWMPIYGIAGAWAFAAALRSRFAVPVQVLLAICVVAYAGLVVYYWPQAPEFWRKDVWWNDEEAREGMGAMIALAVMLFVALTALTARTRRS